MTDPRLPPAAWYADPADPSMLRWWTGAEWSADVHAPLAPVAPPASSFESYAAYAPAAFTATPSAAAPFAPTPERQQSAWGEVSSAYEGAPRGDANTRAIWALALYPILFYAVDLIVGFIAPDFDRLVISIGLLVFIIITVILDWTTLRSRGLPAASPLWLLLGPVGYFIARRVVLKRGGIRHNAPGNVFVLAFVLGAFPFVALTAEQNKVATNDAAVTAIESELSTQLSNQEGEEWEADCPNGTDLSHAGVTMRCSTHNGAGFTVVFVVTTTAPWKYTITMEGPS